MGSKYCLTGTHHIKMACALTLVSGMITVSWEYFKSHTDRIRIKGKEKFAHQHSLPLHLMQHSIAESQQEDT